MSTIALYSAYSLNHKIARADGSVAWLDEIDHPEGEDYGYHDFYASIGTIIMGYSTFQQLLNWGIDWPYPDKKNYVITQKQEPVAHDMVEFVNSNPIACIQAIKRQSEAGIWLIGGGGKSTLLLNAGLIDQMILHIMPVILPDGIDLFEGQPHETKLKLMEEKKYPSGVLEAIYAFK